MVSWLLLISVNSVWSTELVINSSNVKLLNQVEYCVVNDSTIRKKTGDGFLIVINDTGSWLVVTNGSNLFMVMFSLNKSNCEDPESTYNPYIAIYAIQTSIHAIIILVTTCVIVLHLYFKELQTVSGILIILFCIFVIVYFLITLVHNRYQFTHKVNDSGEVCAVLLYLRGILNSLAQFTRLTILFQFAYLMYNAYKVRSGTDNKMILKYIIFIISMTIIYSVMVISYDIAVTKTAFSTYNGYCATKFHTEDASFAILIIQLISILVMQMAVFTVGMVLYCLVNKRCCEFRSTDTRVCLTLGSTAGLNTFLLVVVQLAGGGSEIGFLSSSTGTCIQISILLIIFLTSMKVKTAVSSLILSSDNSISNSLQNLHTKVNS